MARVESSARRAGVIAVAIIAVLIFCPIAASYTVKVSVSEVIESEIKPLSQSWENKSKNNFVALDYDVFDSGSTGYGLRLRADIYIRNSTDTGEKKLPVATIWTKEMPLLPGERNTAAIYWHGGRGNFTAYVRAYRAQEITDVGNISIALDDSAQPESVFTIERARTYDGKIKLQVRSSKDAGDVIIYPVTYPAGWLFEQENAGTIGRNGDVWATIRYDAALFSEQTVIFAIAGNNGKYYSEQAVGLKKEAGISKYLHMFTDSFI